MAENIDVVELAPLKAATLLWRPQNGSPVLTVICNLVVLPALIEWRHVGTADAVPALETDPSVGSPLRSKES